MKVKSVRVPASSNGRARSSRRRRHFYTNASDILFERGDAMGSFRFHGWLVVEIETDDGLVGIGNCALAPRVAKSSTSTWRRSASAKTRSTTSTSGEDVSPHPRLGPAGIGMAAISAVNLAIWDIMGKGGEQAGVQAARRPQPRKRSGPRLEALRQRQPRRLPRRFRATLIQRLHPR